MIIKEMHDDEDDDEKVATFVSLFLTLFSTDVKAMRYSFSGA